MQHRRVAAAVEQDEALLATQQALLHRTEQRRRDHDLFALVARQGSHVDDTHARQRAAADALGQRQAPVRALLGALPGFERRRGRAEQYSDAFVVAAPDRKITRRVARALLLLERRVVLFIDDDQAKPRHRREHRKACAEHEVGMAEVG